MTKVKKFDALTVAWLVTPKTSPNQLFFGFPTFSKSDAGASEVVRGGLPMSFVVNRFEADFKGELESRFSQSIVVGVALGLCGSSIKLK